MVPDEKPDQTHPPLFEPVRPPATESLDAKSLRMLGLDLTVPPASRDEYLLELLRHPLFSGDEQSSLASLLDEIEVMKVPAGTCLIGVGAPPDRIFVLLRGSCRIAHPDGTLEEAGRRDVIGHQALLADLPSPHEVVTVRDTVLARIRAPLLDRMGALSPSLWRALGKLAATWGMGHGTQAEPSMTLALVPLGEVPWKGLARTLRAALEPMGAVIILTSTVQRDSEIETVAWLSSIEKRHRFSIYRADPADSSWSRRCVRQADRVVYVGAGWASPPAELPFADLVDDATQHLILLQPPDVSTATGTARWLDAHAFASHHHVRLACAEDGARAARLLTGHGIGVSLAGASSRAAGHFGLIQALRDLQIPVDIVTGSSAGAVCATTLALEWPLDRGRALFAELLRCMRPSWRTITLPIVALMTGRQPVEALRRLCGEVAFEDMLVPFAVPATDITNAGCYVFRRGPLWKALRATGSLPFFWPPLLHEGRALVDSGLVNNQPLELLTDSCAKGWLIAQELLPPAGQGPLSQLESGVNWISGWSVLWSRIWPFSSPRRVPLLADTLIHSMTIPSYQGQEALAREHAAAPLTTLRPELGDLGFFSVRDDELEALQQVVYRQVLPVLEERRARTTILGPRRREEP